MFVKMLKAMAGPNITPASVDEIVEVPDKQGRELIEGGYAEEAREVSVEYTSRFHGGLTAVQPAKVNVAVPPNPAYSQAREAREGDVVMDRRTADEIAADARLDSKGAVVARGPAAVKTADELEAEEIEAKVAIAQTSSGDPSASAHQRLTADAGLDEDDAEDDAPAKSRAKAPAKAKGKK